MTTATVWNGAELLNAFAVATGLLVENRASIDALNVYPVPDGDTGTNMSLTMQAALNEARQIPSASATVGAIAQRIAHGALLGARGNSGVILSQIYRGFANEIAAAEKMDGRDLARALKGATDVAYKAVMRPVEGTMLTVIRVAAEYAEKAAVREPSLVPVLESAVDGAKVALADTPNLLPTLRDAGVVDSGGQGVALALEGLLAAARGTQPDTSVLDMSGPPSLQLHPDEHDSFGYCTNFMITGIDIPFDRVRAELASMGQSAVIVGDEQTVKVHIHTEHPGKTLEYAIGWGSLSQIKIDNMNAQAATFADRSFGAPEPAPERRGRALVAVASGSGIAEAFRSLGVRHVISGGTTMNPSIDELVRAVDDSGAEDVILLPNNGNVLMAAQQAVPLCKPNVSVLPTKSVVQGLAAASAFSGTMPIDQELARMQRAADRTVTIEIAQADRDALADGVSVKRGQFIGLVNDRLVETADGLVDVVMTSLTRAVTDEHELITVFVGSGASPEDRVAVTEHVRAAYPEQDLDVVDGYQPHYLFVIAVE